MVEDETVQIVAPKKKKGKGKKEKKKEKLKSDLQSPVPTSDG